MIQKKVRYNGKIYHVKKETKDMFCIITFWEMLGDEFCPLEIKNVSKSECEEL